MRRKQPASDPSRPPSPWTTIRQQRRALAADLQGLTDAQWRAQSLCADWTVHDVLAHLATSAAQRPTAFLLDYARSGFSRDRLNARAVALESANPPEQTLARFERLMDAETSPPGPMEALVGEIIVHAEDIRRPLGIPHGYPIPVLTRVAYFYAGTNNVLGSRRRIAGLRLTATDADWQLGDGLPVAGPLLSLILAMTGRDAATIELDGTGVDLLRSRP